MTVRYSALYSGTAFPTTGLFDGYPFHRTDIGAGMDCFYDLTNDQWLTVHEYETGVRNVTFSANGSTYTPRIRDDFAAYIERVNFSSKVATTNDGSNYWSYEFRSSTATISAETAILTGNTSSDSADAWTDHDSAPSAATPANYGWFGLVVTKTLSPGNLTVYFSVSYRLIVT